jgi:hypothetical protein
MRGFLKGLANYRTTITGVLALVFTSLSQSYPDYGPLFDWLAKGAEVLFIVFVKDATTGSSPTFLEKKAA